MKIAILTFHKSGNYGAALQAYALARFLIQLGNEVFFIDYLPDYYFKKEINSWFLGFRPSTIKKNIVSRYRWNKFKRYLPLSTRKYITPISLINNPPIADAYICGSDQIWNTSLLGRFDTNYFLGFVPDDKLRIAYAPSCAGDRKLAEHKDILNGLLKKFDALSIREENDGKFLQSLSDVNIQTVLDPTLMLGDYSPLISKRPNKKDYLLIYCVAEVPNNLANIVKYYSNVFKLVSIDITNWTASSCANKHIKDLGPVEFLNYVYHSSFIITNSFHGTVFSVLFNKPFQVLKLAHDFSSRQVRLDNILDSLELTEYVYPEKQWQNLEAAESSFKQQYIKSNKILEKLQKESRDFLLSALQRKHSIK
ncbi:MAG TPA: polysaccharide pyruvyl transferase family protein [Smithellaceae bacterium]|nr:polysaccharide pyruvyl transferase family protein [Smithellaceae bacterium]